MKQRAYLKNKNKSLVNNEKYYDFKSFLQYSAVPLALLTSLFYLFGRIYYETYLSCWGLAAGMFPLTKEQSIITGFLRYIVYGVTLLPGLAIGLWTIILVVLVSLYRPIVESLGSLLVQACCNVVTALRKKVKITNSHLKILDIIGLVSGCITFLLILTLIFVFSCQAMVKQAKEEALKEYDKIVSKTSNNSLFDSRAVLYIRKESRGFDLYSGSLIATSATHCALYSQPQGVSIFPMANVARMIIHENRYTHRHSSSP